ncbi:hypothetical protein ACFC00_30875 [Streptomyces adustus]|uniref:hypothetical protein n=1 Tax=Streptomyces adustus TaxID=1609272 RepID=UPI0035E04D26
MSSARTRSTQAAAKLRKERVNQILDGKWALSDPYEEMAEAIEDSVRCPRGARGGCGAAKLGSELADLFGPDREEVEEIMERIGESWKRKNTKRSANEFGFSDPAEFQLALTLAVMEHDVMSRNDDQKAPHAGDAWSTTSGPSSRCRRA